MRILNIALNGDYTDGFSYHENLLPKYHKLNGNDVYILASEYVFNEKGEEVKTNGSLDYIDDNGVHIIRLHIKGDKHIGYKIKRFEHVYETIERIRPDVIFCHLFQFLDVLEVVKYVKKHPEVKLYLDSHADYSNSAHTFLSKHFLHGILWKYCAHKALPFAQKFYGVLPARVDFLIERYKLPRTKVELLVMGADDELVEQNDEANVISDFRQTHNISPEDFLIVTGGKIDMWKQQTLLLMDAVNHIDNNNLKLIVFGSVEQELKDKLLSKCSSRVKYLGWINSKDSYPIFAACQLAVFPGRHSVFWEQVCGQGIPIILKRLDGTTHVDVGGNVIFLDQDSEEDIRNAIERLLYNSEEYNSMKRIATDKAMKTFSYRELAKKSIQ